MLKKMIAVLTVCAMLAPLSPAVAADEPTVTPTIEEILNEYHQKAFEAQTQEETSAASTYSRQAAGSSKTLEQETVDTLTAAGYEAYNVTADNYSSLEAELNTDFAEMGLDPDGSYIIVISGEDSQNSSGRSIGGSDIVQQPGAGGGTGNTTSFTYTYQGHTYNMRYVTITSASSPDMVKNSIYTLQPQYIFENSVISVLDTTLIATVDKVTMSPIGTIVSLLAEIATDITTDNNYTELDLGTLTVHAATTWTCDLIQILDPSDGLWYTSQCSEYTISRAYCTGYISDPSTGQPTQYVGAEKFSLQYSPKYYNYELRKQQAVEHYDWSSIACDYIYTVGFYLGNDTGSIIYSSSERPLFEHNRSYDYPTIETQ